MTETPPETERVRTLKTILLRFWTVSRPHHNVLFFSAGFLFDAATLDRIDAWLDLTLQGLYLFAAALLLWLEGRHERGDWSPKGLLQRVWTYEREGLHFLLGGLLSAYVIFYSRSGVGARGALFTVIIAGLFLTNELKEEKNWGLPVRGAVYAFCLASFCTYFVPVLVGGIGDGVFLGALALSAVGFGALVALLAWPGPKETRHWRALDTGWAGVLALALIAALYFLRWIPPVPLALQYAGVYHGVAREGNEFVLKYERRSRWDIFRKRDEPYYYRPGDRLYCFVRIFAPARFRHRILLDYQQRVDGKWISRDKIELPIRGGRDAGYRGFAYKARFEPGDWRIAVETQDGRVVGLKEVRVVADEKTGPRDWRADRM